MSADAYVQALYRLVLQREPDPTGLAANLDHLNATNDPIALLAAMLESEEYRSRSTPSPKPIEPDRLRNGLELLADHEVLIVDVGAQMLGTEVHSYQPLCRTDLRHRIIGFDPLTDRIQERQTAEGGSALTLLPYAIGDGGQHVLHVNNDDATSSLFPLNLELCAKFEHLHSLHTVDRIEVQTHRLDDVLPERTVDFLKLDIQGAELLALTGAQAVLSRTNVIHCEVEFEPIYRDQALLSDVQPFLASRGFALIDIQVPHRYAYRSEQAVDARDRLLWGDAVFFRNAQSARDLASQALIAELVYQKPSFAQHLLEAARAANA